MQSLFFALALFKVAPKFVYFDDEPLEKTESEIRNQEFAIENKSMSTYDIRPVAIMSNLVIKNCQFSHNYGYGDNTRNGLGGAVFASKSVIDIYDSKFDANEAITGGAICNLFSVLHISKISEGNNFTNNFAFLAGGTVMINTISQSTIIQDSEFVNNTCGTKGGAICGFIYDADLVIESCKFINNAAGHNGGAIGFRGNDKFAAFVSDCVFMENSAGKASTLQRDISNFLNYIEKNDYNAQYHGRGCPGIFLQEGNLNTQGCTFLHNHQYFPRYNVLGDGVHSTFYLNAQGASIMLADVSSWISDGDCITNYFTYNHNGIPPVLHFSKLNKTCGDLVAKQSIHNPVAPVNQGDGSPANIPQPTTFTYQATPITQAPQATSNNYSEYHTYIKDKPKTNNYKTLTPEPTDYRFPPNVSTTVITTSTTVVTQSSTFVSTKVLSAKSDQNTTTYVEIETTLLVFQSTFTNVMTEKITLLDIFLQNPGDGKKGPNILLIAILVSIGVLLIIIAVALIVYFKWKKEHKSTSSEETIDAGEAAGTTKTQVIHTNPDEVSCDLSENETLQDAPSHDTDMEYMNNDDF